MEKNRKIPVKYSLQKYAIYNSFTDNIFKINSDKFIIDYFNTILYFIPNSIIILITKLKYDYQFIRHIDDRGLDNYLVMIMNNLDPELKFYQYYIDIINREIHSSFTNRYCFFSSFSCCGI